MRPKRLLLCWPYQRSSLLRPFLDLAAGGRFDLIHLYHSNPSDENSRPTPHPVRFWEEFSSAQQVLAETRPDAIVFQGIGSPRTVALNTVAKDERILTYILDHGSYQRLEDSRRFLEARNRYAEAHPHIRLGGGATETPSTEHSASFLRASFRRAHRFEVPLVFAFAAFFRASSVPQLVYPHFRFSGRLPVATICHSRVNAEVAFQYDGDLVPRVVIGNPEYDGFFRAAYDDGAGKDYYLFVDSLVASPELGDAFMTKSDAIEVYRRVAKFAERKGKRLLVKLHPGLIDAAWLPRHLPNVDWVKDGNLSELVSGAIACFGYMSTLLVHAAWHRPVCVIKAIDLDSVADFARAAGGSAVWPHELDPHSFEFPVLDPARRLRLEERFFGPTDGRATERLGKVLSDGIARDAVERGW